MIRKIAGLLLLIVASTATAVELSELGFEVIRTRPDGVRTAYEVRSPGGDALVVSYRGELSRSQGEILDRLVDTFFGFDYIQVSELRIVFTEARAEILLVPQRFRYENQDLAQYMPAGMQFFFGDFLEYDFRIRVDDLFLRINGQFTTEEQFADRLVRAVANPVAYLQTQDPQFVFERFREIEAIIETLERDSQARQEALQAELNSLTRRYENTVAELDSLERSHRDLNQAHQSLRRSHENLSVAHSALRDDYQRLLADHQGLAEQHAQLDAEFAATVDRAEVAFAGLDASHRELRTEHDALRVDHDTLQIAHDELTGEHIALAERHEALVEEKSALDGRFARLRYAMIIAENTGFLGIRFPMAQADVIDRVVEAKTDRPELTRSDVRDLLDEEGLDAPGRLVDLVFEIYFNDYPED